VGTSEAVLISTNFGGGVNFESDEQKFLQDFRHRVEQRDRTMVNGVGYVFARFGNSEDSGMFPR